MTAAEHPPADSLEVRARLVDAVKLDLVGPWAGHALGAEQLPGRERPSNWYVAGFLIPTGTPPDRSGDADEDDDLDTVPESAGLSEESNDERKAARKAFFPSSIGLSFLVAGTCRELAVTARWGDYAYVDTEEADGGRTAVWRRTPREETLPIPLDGGAGPVVRDVPNSNGLQLHVAERPIDAMGPSGAHLPAGTRSVSCFLVNRRPPDGAQPDRAYAFQAEIEVRTDEGFVPRPDLRGAHAGDWDDRVADLHYADTPEYAAGHGVSAEWELVDGECRSIRTAWIGTAEVEKTATADAPGVELSMEALGRLDDATERNRDGNRGTDASMEALGRLDGGLSAAEALGPLVAQYREWIDSRRQDLAAGPPAGDRRDTAGQLLHYAGIAADRMARGVALLGEDADLLDAFRVANRAVARALRRRLGEKIGPEGPRWRPFQLAFLLLNLPGLADPRDAHRDTVDLLFFPTGGGKTEAYLGLAAVAMVLRRLRHPGDDGLAGAGVSVIMRYTLRLLTLDQLARAAGLVCALEIERREAGGRYGAWPFEIGLWVGKAATPNILGRKGDGRPDSARAKVNAFKRNPDRNPSPIPLENCPWCRTRFAPESFTLLPDADNPRELRIVCTDFECEFSGDRPLPVVGVDEPIYRRLPAFLIATVDKFASLPWVGQAGALLGGADRFDAQGFHGAAEPGTGKRLHTSLPPPDLVIQDELHLIAGPLGTMAGLYETAIEALAVRQVDGRTIKPKIVASTATARRAQDQVQALFARPTTHVFPPPGPDRRDTFFARTVPAPETPARLYVGIASQGRNPKVLMRRVLLALMGAAEHAWHAAGGDRNARNPADPYMTTLAYFNSLRELGGARRILEEEVGTTIARYGARRRIGETQRLFRDRTTFSEVLELTSRVSTDQVAGARRRLECPFNDRANRVDCALATNMISVGLDIPRLGLMLVLGQPKMHAEYIQATSRVGRSDDRPGLVVTLLNVHKPRDRSHYERFRHYHETFYRSVEPASVTPFSARALDRGFAGALVALARHLEPALTPPRGVERIADVRAALESRLLDAFIERVGQQAFTEDEEREEGIRSVQDRVGDLLDSWRRVLDDYHGDGVEMQYQRHELRQPKPLLREMLEERFECEHHRKFRANRSLRDVEPEVNLYLHDLRAPGPTPSAPFATRTSRPAEDA